MDAPTAPSTCPINGAQGSMSPVQLKALGNELYREGRYEEAVRVFTTLLEAGKASLMVALYSRPPLPVAELLALIHANRAAAYLKLEKYYDVVEDCGQALSLATDPFGPYGVYPEGGPAFGYPCPISEEARRTVIKALGRRSAAREALDDLPAAIIDIQHAIILDYEDEFEATGRYKRMLEKWREQEKAKELNKHALRQSTPGTQQENMQVSEDGLVEEQVRHTRRKRCALCRRAKEKGRLALRVCCCYKVYYCSLYCQKTHWNTHAPECTYTPQLPSLPQV